MVQYLWYFIPTAYIAWILCYHGVTLRGSEVSVTMSPKIWATILSNHKTISLCINQWSVLSINFKNFTYCSLFSNSCVLFASVVGCTQYTWKFSQYVFRSYREILSLENLCATFLPILIYLVWAPHTGTVSHIIDIAVAMAPKRSWPTAVHLVQTARLRTNILKPSDSDMWSLKHKKSWAKRYLWIKNSRTLTKHITTKYTCYENFLVRRMHWYSCVFIRVCILRIHVTTRSVKTQYNVANLTLQVTTSFMMLQRCYHLWYCNDVLSYDVTIKLWHL